MVPELQLTGYPPEDLVLKPAFVRRTMEAAERLVDATAEPGPALLFGSIHHEAGLNYNVMILSEGGQIVARGTPAELARPRGVEVDTGDGVRSFPDATREDVPRIVADLVSSGEQIYGVNLLASTLEDAYLEAVGAA